MNVHMVTQNKGTQKMTNLQLQAVLLTAKLGSISAAAKELNVSQPNASSSIKLLEDEIGFQIFYRTSAGAELTPKGEQFIEHARQILEESEKIMGLKSSEDIYRLRVGSSNFSCCIFPLLKICEEHRNDKETDFCYVKVSAKDGIAALLDRKLDVVIAPALANQISGIQRECKKNNIALEELCILPTEIALREGHPALKDGRCENIVQGSDAMKDYPYVAYRNLMEDIGSTGYNDSDFAQCSYKIFVDDFDSRLRVLRSSNGFAFGVRSSRKFLDEYGLVSYIVPGVKVVIYAMTRQTDSKRKEVKEYLELLMEELKDSAID